MLFYGIAGVAMLFVCAYILAYAVTLLRSAFSGFDIGEYTGEIFATLVLLSIAVITFFFVIRPLYNVAKTIVLHELDQRRYAGFKYLYRIDNMDPLTFEKFVGFVLQNEGLRDVTFTPQVNDGGIDLFGHKDGKRIAVQVKKYNRENGVGRVSLQSFVGAYDRQVDEGWFVTSSFFNKNAKEFAKTRSELRLIDGLDFGQMIGRLPDNDSWIKTFLVDPLLPSKSGALDVINKTRD